MEKRKIGCFGVAIIVIVVLAILSTITNFIKGDKSDQNKSKPAETTTEAKKDIELTKTTVEGITFEYPASWESSSSGNSYSYKADENTFLQLQVAYYNEETFDSLDTAANNYVNLLSKSFDSFLLKEKKVEKVNGHDCAFVVGEAEGDNDVGYYISSSIFAENGVIYDFAFAYRQQDEEYGQIYDDVIRSVIVNSTYKPATEATTETTEAKKEDSEGLSEEFKEACDGYEKFIDEYVDFMKTYSESDDVSTLMVKYLEFLETYTTEADKFEKLGDMEMNDAESEYYTKVQLRASKKLVEAGLSLSDK